MRIRILGCGTSTGVPRLGSGWGSCDPAEPKNRRLRSSILVESAGETLLVDCGPDLREQFLAAGLSVVDRVLVTHDHADHCHGSDDLRPIEQLKGAPSLYSAQVKPAIISSCNSDGVLGGGNTIPVSTTPALVA